MNMSLKSKKFKKPIKLFYLQSKESGVEFQPGIPEVDITIVSSLIENVGDMQNLYEKFDNVKMVGGQPEFKEISTVLSLDRQLLIAILCESNLVENE